MTSLLSIIEAVVRGFIVVAMVFAMYMSLTVDDICFRDVMLGIVIGIGFATLTMIKRGGENV